LTRQVLPVERLVRFVAGPDGVLVPDLKRRLPGRGVWITASRDAVAQAQKKKVFPRALKDGSVRIEGDLAEQVDMLLERAALNAISLARKAGEVVAGFSKVEAALRGQDVIGLVQARDGGDDGARKLAAIARARFADAGTCRTIGCFTSAQLDLALGRSNVIHAALLAGRAGGNALVRVEELERFRTGSNDGSAAGALPAPDANDGAGDAVIQD
jgi:hypothetical protein